MMVQWGVMEEDKGSANIGACVLY